MRKSFRGKKPQKTTKDFRINERIFAPELVVIDEEGNNLGQITKEKALQEARDRDLDLVEVSPKAEPPIAKLMDYGSFKYQQEKQEKKAKSKQKNVELKTVKTSARMGQHDIDIRIDRTLKFLEEGNKVKIELQLRGREHRHIDLAKENIQEMLKTIGEKFANPIKVEQEIKIQGSRISTVIST